MPTTVIVLLGVSGSGKSTVGAALADRLGWRFLDGDAFHPAGNRAKMAAGRPLTDDDRWPWLAELAGLVDTAARTGDATVLACSGLKKRYRDLLRGGLAAVSLVLLDCDRTELRRRLSERSAHFFPADLLDSQLAALEPPLPAEEILTVNGDRDPGEIIDDIKTRLSLAG